MNGIVARLCGRARGPILFGILVIACAGNCSAAERAPTPHATRQELIGAWRLLSIEVVGPAGPTVDPFYGADPTGMLIYDPSGWMSVQIAGRRRPAMDAAASRPTHDNHREARLKAGVLDTYYAYLGTWEYDEATSTVTHYVKTSLIPGEAGMSYAQTVTVEGGRLIFTTRRQLAGGAAVQKKVWQRISGPQG